MKRNISGLLLVERYVLEILAPQGLACWQLEKESKLPPHLLMEVLEGLKDKGVLLEREGLFFIEQGTLPQFNESINTLSNVRLELKELMEAMINFHFVQSLNVGNPGDSIFKLKKVSMRREELAILRSLLRNVDTYLDNLSRDRASRGDAEKEAHDRQVIYWGQIPYRSLLKGHLHGM